MGLKEAYAEKMEGQLKQYLAKIDELKAKADQAEAEAKIQYEKQLQEVTVKVNQAQAKMREFQSASENAWEQLKKGMDTAWGDLKGAVEEAASKFK